MESIEEEDEQQIIRENLRKYGAVYAPEQINGISTNYVSVTPTPPKSEI
jgi:hypothetical protein